MNSTTTKPTVYLETSFLSYLAARPSRDLVTAQRQIASHDWWNSCRHNYDLVISPAVLEEIVVGDPEQAARRRQLLSDVRLLPAATPDLSALVLLLLEPFGPIPSSARPDAVHVATATFYRIQYLLTWNFRHIANAQIRRQVDNILRSHGYETSVICTPEELAPADFD